MSDTTSSTQVSLNHVKSENNNEVAPFEGTSADVHARNTEDLSRIESNAASSRRLSRAITGSEKLIEDANNTNEPLPPMGGGRDYPPPLPSRDPYTVSYDGPKDPLHPQNWSLRTRVLQAAVVGLSALSVSLGSAMFSAATTKIVELYGVGTTVATLGTSLFVFGFASGPIIWGPLCELYGRKIIMLCSNLGYICFSFAVATAHDLQTIMICRFFAGFIGAAPLVVAPAVMADIFGNKSRGTAVTIFALVLFGGPMLAPIFGGFIMKNPKLGWRWTSYFCGIVGSLALIGTTFLQKETHHGIILVQKAEKLRRRTGNWGIAAPHEEFSLSIKEIVEKNLSRPLVMLFTEPILLLITIYNAFVYGMLYLCLTAVPYIYSVNYHFGGGIAELPYLAMFIGIFIAAPMNLLFERRYNRIMEKVGRPVAEERLPPVIIGGVVFAIGLFWVGWSGSFPDKVHWIVPTIGLGFIGFGLLAIFLPCLNYIVDCYLFYAASALAGNTFLRSAFGAVFPLFARPMIVNMKIKWAVTLLGCIAVVLVPVPVLFYRYGKAIRKNSKFSPNF